MKNYATTRSFLVAMAAIVLTLALVPLTAQAAGNVKAIQLGAGGVVGPSKVTKGDATYYAPNSYVWFGANGAPGKPIKWRVLDAAKANDGRTVGMFLLSEHLLAGGVKFDDNSNAYQGSDAQEWCKGFASKTSNFSEAEQGAMLGVAKKDDDENDLYGISWVTSELTTKDKMFFLSVRELADHVGNYDPAPGMAASFDDGSAGAWWLRSPHEGYPHDAGMVLAGGIVSSNSVDDALAVRPAFNLDLGSVLFTSAAVGGKSAAAGGEIFEIPETATTEWKLTLKDDGRANFSASITAASEKEVTFSWEGAETGPDEWISAVITDADGDVKYYGRVAQAEKAKGTATVKMPAKLGKTDRLCIFNEQYNGDKKTDYASPLVELATLPGATVGAKYTQKLEATGLTAPLEWELAKKTKKDRLPAGLKLSKAGKISGTPTEAGTFAFTVQVTDAQGKSATKALLLTVEKGGGPAAPEGLVATPPTAQGMSDGTISGVDPTMEWSADGGETWTDCPATGPITGLAPGDYLVRYKATEKAGPSDAATVTVPESGAPTSHPSGLGRIGGVEIVYGEDGRATILRFQIWLPDGTLARDVKICFYLARKDASGAVVRAAAEGDVYGPFVGRIDSEGWLTVDVDGLRRPNGARASLPAGEYDIFCATPMGAADPAIEDGMEVPGGPFPLAATDDGGEGKRGGSGSGGCDAGFGALALMAVAMVAILRRKA